MGFRPDVAANDLTGVLKDTDSRTVNVERTHDVPTGTVLEFAGTRLPPGFLFCDGSPVSRATYRALFNVLGVTYGVGDGTTTFNLPDITMPMVPNDGFHHVGAVGEPPFLNGWVNVGGGGVPLTFHRDPFGRVAIYGEIASGTVGTDIFVLPVGYRPPAALYFAVVGDGGAAGNYVQVTGGGDVVGVRAGTGLLFTATFETEALTQRKIIRT